MNDALGSYRCGAKVEADFCLGEPVIYNDDDNNRQYKCNNLGFSTSKGKNENAGPLEDMNIISSIVIRESGLKEINRCIQTLFFSEEDCIFGGGTEFRPELVEP